jgi:hypothetical protein
VDIDRVAVDIDRVEVNVDRTEVHFAFSMLTSVSPG